jgi:hypothetical protein
VAATLSAANNNYIGCASFYPGDDGSFKARKAQFAACHFLMLDDLGTKVPLERLAGFELSWLIETSPGNHQGGIILAEPLTDGAAGRATAQRGDRLGAVRCRRDRAIESLGAAAGGDQWQTKICRRSRCTLSVSPDRMATGRPLYATRDCGSPAIGTCSGRATEENCQTLGTRCSVDNISRSIGNDADDVLTPRAAENPVVAALKARGLYKTPLGSGKHDMTCPWVQEHTDQLDTGAAYFEPDEFYSVGGFCCQHSHRDKYHIRALLEFLGVRNAEARHKPVIRVVAGDLHRVVDAAEKELANRGRHYQAGGLIVSVSTDPTSGDPSIVPTSAPALTRELSVAATWEKYDGRAEDWVRCDPPTRHAAILYDAQSFRYLPPLAGVCATTVLSRVGRRTHHAGRLRQDGAAFRRVRCAAVCYP